MRGSLGRVLRLRALFENVSRADLEQRLQRLARIDAAIEDERAIDAACRKAWFAEVGGERESRGEERVLSEIDREMARWRAGRLEPIRRREAEEADRAREAWLGRRKERRQVEMVMETRMREAKTEEERRMQRRLDDWFQLRYAQAAARRRRDGRAGDPLRDF